MNRKFDLERRNALKAGGSVGLLALFAGLGLLHSGAALASGMTPAFAAKSMDEVLKAMGVIELERSALIQLTVPEIAENGAVVPITVVSTLPGIEQISILVAKNPSPLAASFTILPGTEGRVTTRVKMGGTSNVIALIKADGKFYRSSKEVKVTAGGCGG